jgi:hypothetical protein
MPILRAWHEAAASRAEHKQIMKQATLHPKPSTLNPNP